MKSAAATQQQPYGVVYMIKNSVNGKCYIGQTVQDFNTRWNEHTCYARNRYNKCIKLENSIRKYGEQAFVRGILAECHSQQELDEAERYFIEKYNTMKHGYNIREGGSKGRLSEDSKRKIGDANRGRVRSDETRRKMSKSHLGKNGPRMPDHVRQAIRDANVGRKHSEESKEKIRQKLVSFNAMKRRLEAI